MYVFLRSYPLRILRQKVIDHFIVDFYCAKVKLAIELDGSQHYTDEGTEYDVERTRILEAYGIKVIRFSNLEIDKYFDGVCEMINMEIRCRCEMDV